MLTTLDCKPVQLSKQLAHGPLVLVVLRGWPGYQCPICTRQVGQLIAQAEDLKTTGAQSFITGGAIIMMLFPSLGLLRFVILFLAAVLGMLQKRSSISSLGALQ